MLGDEREFRRPGTLGRKKSRKIIEKIHRRIKVRGHGALNEAERRLLFHDGHITQLKTLGDLRLSVLFELADELGVSAESLLSDDDDSEWSLAERRLPIIDLILACCGSGELDESRFLSFLALDEARFENPMGVVRAISSIDLDQNQTLSENQGAQLLGIASSCYAKLFDFDSSFLCIDSALRINNRSPELFLRKAGVFVDLSLYSAAEKLIYRVQDLAIREFNLGAIAESLCLLGFMSYQREKPDEARAFLSSATRYRKFLSKRKRCSLLQLTGLVCTSKKQSEERLEKALDIAQEISNPEYTAKIMWAIAMNQDYPEEKAAILEPAVSNFPDHCAIDKALALIDLAGAYLDTGKETLALKKIKQGFVLIDKLAFIPEAERAFCNLVSTAARCMMLNSQILAKSREEIFNARARFVRALARPNLPGWVNCNPIV